VVVTIVREGAPGAMSASWATENGTGVAGADFGMAGNSGQYQGTLFWPDGDFSPRTIVIGGAGATVPILDDSAPEPDKTFSLALEVSGANAALSNGRTMITIVNDDSDIGFSIADASVTEYTFSGSLAVRRNGRTDSMATVNWITQNGTAQAGSDFGAPGSTTQVSGTLWFYPGETVKYIEAGYYAVIPIIDDGVPETDETFGVRLLSATGAPLNANRLGTFTIVGTQASIYMEVADSSVPENAGQVLVNVRRGGTDNSLATSVQYNVAGGSAISGRDFTAVSGTLTWGPYDSSTRNIAVPILDNNVVNLTARSFQVRLSSPSNSVLGTPSTTLVSIVDDDSTVQLAVSAATITEGTANLVLNVTRTGSVASPVSVNWAAVDGTAVAGTDFGSPTSGTITWAGNDTTTKQIVIPIVNDTIPEPTKIFTVALSSPSNVKLGGITTAAITLKDDDAGVAFSQPDYVIDESAARVSLQVQRIGPSTAAASVRWAASNGSATIGLDFGLRSSATSPSGTLNWAAGDATARTIVIPILQDTASEGDETFTVALSNPSAGLRLGTPATATVKIVDDDIPLESKVSFVAPKVVVLESAGSAIVTVHREPVAGGFTAPLTVNYATAAGTAMVTSDFITRSGRLSWNATETADKIISIPIVDNAAAEPPKWFKVTLSTTSPGAQVETPAAIVTILDDDEAFPPFGAIPDGWTMPIDANGGWHLSGDAGAYEGAYSLRSDEIEDGQSAKVEVTRGFVAGNVTFRVKVSSEPKFDVLRFYVDGAEKGAWSGTSVPGWQLFSTPVTAGIHTLRWSYEKDGSASVGADAAWIDAVTLP
jgi:serralysin